MIKVNTENKTQEDLAIIDKIINLETIRKISKVKGADNFGIMTACFINDEFVLCSEYEISNEMEEELRKA
ncbi:MAG: hypothetical protein ACPGSO_00710 [Vicingaceae bacterium]